MNKMSNGHASRRTSPTAPDAPDTPWRVSPAGNSGSPMTQPPGCAVQIDPEFGALVVPLPVAERAQLEQELLAEGCKVPLVVWAGHDGTLLDGHQRLEICVWYGIPFRIEARAFADREADRAFVIAGQLGRNPTALAVSYLRGKRYLALKGRGGRRPGPSARSGGTDRNGPAVGAGSGDQNDHCNGSAAGNGDRFDHRTARRLAKEYHSSEGTIRRDGHFGGWVDALAANCGEEARRLIVSREVHLTRKDVAGWARLPVPEQRRLLQQLLARGRPERPKRAKDQMLVPREPEAFGQTVADKLGRGGCGPGLPGTDAWAGYRDAAG